MVQIDRAKEVGSRQSKSGNVEPDHSSFNKHHQRGAYYHLLPFSVITAVLVWNSEHSFQLLRACHRPSFGLLSPRFSAIFLARLSSSVCFVPKAKALNRRGLHYSVRNRRLSAIFNQVFRC